MSKSYLCITENSNALMKYLIYITLFFSMSAFSAEKYYRAYLCDTAAQMYSCNEGCKKMTRLVQNFKADVAKNSVKVSSHILNGPNKIGFTEFIMDKCVVVDEKNWKCFRGEDSENFTNSTNDIIITGLSFFKDRYGCAKLVDENFTFDYFKNGDGVFN
jgi:hypothetical protein